MKNESESDPLSIWAHGLIVVLTLLLGINNVYYTRQPEVKAASPKGYAIEHYIGVNRPVKEINKIIPKPEPPKPIEEPKPAPKPDFARLAHDTAIAYRVNPDIVKNLIRCESGWREKAINDKNKNKTIDYGFFQLNSGGTMQYALKLIGEEPTVENALTGEKNIKAGVALLAKSNGDPWVHWYSSAKCWAR